MLDYLFYQLNTILRRTNLDPQLVQWGSLRGFLGIICRMNESSPNAALKPCAIYGLKVVTRCRTRERHCSGGRSHHCLCEQLSWSLNQHRVDTAPGMMQWGDTVQITPHAHTSAFHDHHISEKTYFKSSCQSSLKTHRSPRISRSEI